MITTEKFELNKNEYLSVILRILIKKKWWKYLLCWVLATLFTLENDKNSLMIFCIVFLYAFPFIMVFEYWRFANSKENRNIFGKRYYEISDDKIFAYLENGTTSTIKIENFIKTYELKDYYFLYLAKNQSLYFPKNIFKSEEDLKWFKENIFSKI